jgi:hypothetical protein
MTIFKRAAGAGAPAGRKIDYSTNNNISLIKPDAIRARASGRVRVVGSNEWNQTNNLQSEKSYALSEAERKPRRQSIY